MARLHPVTLALPPIEYHRGWDPKTDPHEIAMRELQEVSDNLPEGEVVGAVLRFPFADSYATYLVTKASPLTLQHVDYMDGWQVQDALIRGIRKQDVLDQLDRGRRMRALFAQKRAEQEAQV